MNIIIYFYFNIELNTDLIVYYLIIIIIIINKI